MMELLKEGNQSSSGDLLCYHLLNQGMPRESLFCSRLDALGWNVQISIAV